MECGRPKALNSPIGKFCKTTHFKPCIPLTSFLLGTLPFISLRLNEAWKRNRPALHTAADDLESLAWVLLSISQGCNEFKITLKNKNGRIYSPTRFTSVKCLPIGCPSVSLKMPTIKTQLSPHMVLLYPLLRGSNFEVRLRWTYINCCRIPTLGTIPQKS